MSGPVDSKRRGLGGAYWRLWAAATISSVGDGFLIVALPLLAATLTRDPRLIAGLVVTERLPWLLFALPAGAWADRLPRARLMVAVDGLRGSLLALLAVAVMTHRASMVLLYAVGFCLSALEAFFSAAAQAAIPAVVETDQLDRANGHLLSGQMSGEQVVGPALGGGLFALVASVPFLADACSFLGSAVLLRGLRTKLPAPERTSGSSLRTEMAEGVRYFWSSPILRPLGLFIGGLAACQAMVMAVMVLFGLEVLHLSRFGYGVFLAAGAIGNVLGSVVAPRVKHRFGTASVLTGGAFAAAGAYVLLSTASSAPLAVALVSIEAVAVACASVASFTLRQESVPDALRGRVSNVFRICVFGAVPFGAMAGGLIGHAIGIRAVFLVAGAAQGLLTVACASRMWMVTGGAAAVSDVVPEVAVA